MSNVASLSAEKFERSRDIVNLLFKETRNCESSRIFRHSFFSRFFANHFFILYFFFFFFLSPGCSSSIAISTLIDRGTLIPNIPESGALDINLFSSLSYFRNSGLRSSLFPLVRTLYGPSSSLSLVPCIPLFRLAALYFRPFQI